MGFFKKLFGRLFEAGAWIAIISFITIITLPHGLWFNYDSVPVTRAIVGQDMYFGSRVTHYIPGSYRYFDVLYCVTPYTNGPLLRMAELNTSGTGLLIAERLAKHRAAGNEGAYTSTGFPFPYKPTGEETLCRLESEITRQFAYIFPKKQFVTTEFEMPEVLGITF